MSPARAWQLYCAERDTPRERSPTAEESAKKWGEYLRDVDKLGEARAAEIHLRRTPAAGRARDRDFGL